MSLAKELCNAESANFDAGAATQKSLKGVPDCPQ